MALSDNQNTLVGFEQGGSTLFVKSGGTIRVDSGGSITGADTITGLLATAAELNRAADVSTRIVSATASTLTVTELLHDGKTIVMDRSGGIAITLPAATASGMRLRFIVGSVSTTGYVIKSVVGTDLMEGCIMGNDGGGVTTTLRWQAGATDDTITLNGTTSGGVDIGDWVELEDISATGWAVRGVVSQSGNEITPFSDSVA